MLIKTFNYTSLSDNNKHNTKQYHISPVYLKDTATA